MPCNVFVKYVLTLQPINKGQCGANNYLSASGLLFFAKAGKLSVKFMVNGFVLVFFGCSVLTWHSTLTTTQPITVVFIIFLATLLMLTLLWAVAG
jgi:hypothetical protein